MSRVRLMSRASSPRSIEELRRKFDDRDPGPRLKVLSPAQVAANEAERLRSVEHISEPDMLAMMHMSDQLRHQAIYHAERQRYSCPPFTLSNFIALRDQGLAYKPEGKRFHILTTLGQARAGAVADYLVKTKGIHASYMLGHIGPTTTLACTCGWSAGLRRGDNMHLKAANAFSSHLRDLQARQTINDMAASIVPRHCGEDDFNQETEG